jgi:hypothetical protein
VKKKKTKSGSKGFLSNYDKESIGMAKSSRMPKNFLNS